MNTLDLAARNSGPAVLLDSLLGTCASELQIAHKGGGEATDGRVDG